MAAPEAGAAAPPRRRRAGAHSRRQAPLLLLAALCAPLLRAALGDAAPSANGTGSPAPAVDGAAADADGGVAAPPTNVTPVLCGAAAAAAWPPKSGAPRPCRGWTFECDASRLNAEVARRTRWTPAPSASEPGRHVLRVSLPGCATTALTPRNVNACLRGRHIVFFGDSLTRYQYISLALFLEYGTWDHAGAAARPAEYVQGWGGYNGLSRGVAARLRGHEICDCNRGARVFETRYYYHPGLQVRLTFAWRTGTLPMLWHHRGWIGERCQAAALERARAALAGRGEPPPASARCPQRGCAPGACGADAHRGRSVAPRDDFAGAARLIRELRPDAAVFNVGLWTKRYGRAPALSRLVAMGEGVRRELGAAAPLLAWRTTTARQPGARWEAQPVIASTLAAAGWLVVDAGAATAKVRELARGGRVKQFYYDNTHFRRFVYRGINELLLASLCSAGTPW